MTTAPRIWVAIPAAGVGRRMSGEAPKQYLPLAGKKVIEWSLEPFISRDDISGIAVAIASGDSVFSTLAVAKDARIKSVIGGAERSDSVFKALASFSAEENDWVLVHDAARPCLHSGDLDRLISDLRSHEVGGILAARVADTLKSADSEMNAIGTVSRENLWRALTPQMFRFGILQRALRSAIAVGNSVTDESSAIEAFGLLPRIVIGRADNIKITLPEDLRHAEFILQQRLRS